jgi:hypothetical protein
MNTVVQARSFAFNFAVRPPCGDTAIPALPQQLFLEQHALGGPSVKLGQVPKHPSSEMQLPALN